MKSDVMIIEDQKAAAALYGEVLEEAGFAVDHFENGAEALEAIVSGVKSYSLIITDYQVPGLDGLTLLKRLKQRFAYLPVLFITAHGSVETAIEAMKQGAFDYQEKPIDLDRLVELAREACARAGDAPVIQKAPSTAAYMVGRSPQMLAVYKQVGRVAALPATVLIRGETGTGKELVAQAIHQFSPRAEKPFVAVNCAAIPEALLESELFGYEKGAFTGAVKTRQGHFERANHGTLFLDEIGDMPWNTQVKLLRVLQERSIQRLGGDAALPVDVRVLAATHRDLEQMIAQQQFRQDLFHRLAVIEINLPPLRERIEDLPALVEHFLAHFCEEYACAPSGIEPAALDLLRQQPWPGNVRQLQNVLRKALLSARNLTISAGDVQATLRAPPPGESPPTSARPNADTLRQWVAEKVRQAALHGSEDLRQRLVDELDSLLAAEALEQCQGNRSRASRLLGVTRRTLRQRVAEEAE